MRLKCIHGVENLQKNATSFSINENRVQFPSVPLVNHVSCFLDKDYNIHIFILLTNFYY